MIALLEYEESQSERIVNPYRTPYSTPQHTMGAGRIKGNLRLIFSGEETYDNIRMKGTARSLLEEEYPMTKLENDISIIRMDVALLKNDVKCISENTQKVPDLITDVAELKNDVAVIKTEIKHITENTQKVPGLVTDVAVIKTEIGHMNGSIKTTNGILVAIAITILGGIIVGTVLPYIAQNYP